ncbi:MAG: CBS domain-containing protein [Gemmataceae bacterium]|nr:CBS domain-containing protein [Gemmataceae bacterium]
MNTTTTAFESLTARDLMSRELIRIPQDMSMRDAARLLFQNGISGAPVVDAQGACIGVLATTDFVALTSRRLSPAAPAEASAGCGFQKKEVGPDGAEVTLCTLPLGTCPLQAVEKRADGTAVLLCVEPDSVLADWQVVELARLPDGAVTRYMTPEPVMVAPDTPIARVARLMADLHIHRVIVAGSGRKPIGIVTSTDILTACAACAQVTRAASTPP